MFRYIGETLKVLKALCQGLGITGRWFFKPSVTLQFPVRKMIPPERFRGTLSYDKESCTACNLCATACPSACISMEPATDPSTGRRMPKISWYQIDFGKCNYCGLCEEACPTRPVKAIRHSRSYEWAVRDRSACLIRWERGFQK